MSKPSASAALIYILAAIIALGPLSVDLYLPAMPAMRDFFGANVSQVQLTLSSYLLGFSIFHLLCGPLSDRFGRKPILLLGLGLYVVMSVFCALSQTVEELIIYRFFQAMGACCAPTLGRAIVRDVYPEHEAVKVLAYVSSLMAIAPIIAPSLGGVLIMHYAWPVMFWALAGFGIVAMLLANFCVPESLPCKQSLRLPTIFKNYSELLRHRIFLGYVLTSSLLYSCTFAFLSGASFVLIDFMQVPAQHFGLYFLFIVAGYISGNLLTARKAHAWQDKTIYNISMTLPVVATSVMVIFAWLKIYAPLLYVMPMFFCTISIGLFFPKAMAEALKPFPHMAATASALMGFLQMSVASIAGALVGVFLVDEPMPMALVLLGGSLLAMLSRVILLPLQGSKNL